MISNLTKWQLAVRKAPRGKLAHGTKLVLLILATYMDTKELTCFPGTDEIAAASGLSRRAVIAHIDRAVAAGFLQKSKKGLSGQQWSRNQYRGLLGCDETSQPSAQACDETDKKPVTKRHTNLSPELAKEGQSPGRAEEYVFEGRIIRLKTGDWEARKTRYGLSDAQLARWMNDRDRWLRTLPPDDRRVSDWWHPTWKALEAEVEGILKSAACAREEVETKPKERRAVVVWG